MDRSRVGGKRGWRGGGDVGGMAVKTKQGKWHDAFKGTGLLFSTCVLSSGYKRFKWGRGGGKKRSLQMTDFVSKCAADLINGHRICNQKFQNRDACMHASV